MTAFSSDDLVAALTDARNFADAALAAAMRGHWWAVDYAAQESRDSLSVALSLLFHPADLPDDAPVPPVGHIETPAVITAPPVDNQPPIGG